MTATTVVSGTRSLESTNAVRRRWPAMFAAAAHMDAGRMVDKTSGFLQGILDEESGGRGAEVVIVAAPVHSAQESALELAAICGRINNFGGFPKDRPSINFNSSMVHYKELVATNTTVCSTAVYWQATQIANLDLVNLSDIINQRFPLVDAMAAFVAVEDLKSLKFVLEPST